MPRSGKSARPISIDAGKVVFGPHGSTLFEAGPHPELLDGDDPCALLAG